MISAANTLGYGRAGAPRRPSFAGMGHQALLAGFMEELRRQQAKSCGQNVDEIKRAGISDKLTGKWNGNHGEEHEKFTF